MSKLKALYEIVDDVKKNSKKEPGLFSYVPESIENHFNNQKNSGKGIYD